MLEHGRGIGQSFEEARIWYEAAAEQEHVDSLVNLAVMYEVGKGAVGQDVRKALELLRKAVDLGDAAAKGEIDRIHAARAARAQAARAQAAKPKPAAGPRRKASKKAKQRRVGRGSGRGGGDAVGAAAGADPTWCEGAEERFIGGAFAPSESDEEDEEAPQGAFVIDPSPDGGGGGVGGGGGAHRGTEEQGQPAPRRRHHSHPPGSCNPSAAAGHRRSGGVGSCALS